MRSSTCSIPVDSDFEHRRVLNAVLRRSPKDGATVRRLFQAAARIGSDYFEQAEFLGDAAKADLVESGRDAFFGAMATIGSDFEQRRALTAVVERVLVFSAVADADGLVSFRLGDRQRLRAGGAAAHDRAPAPA